MASSSGPSTSSSNFLASAIRQSCGKSCSSVQLFTKSVVIGKVWLSCGLYRNPVFLRREQFGARNFLSETSSGFRMEEDLVSIEENAEEEESQAAEWVGKKHTPPVVQRRRRRYRNRYPGEEKGITEEMRFVAMKLRNNGKIRSDDDSAVNSESEVEGMENENEKEGRPEGNIDTGDGETWQPSMEGFLKYLVDSKLVYGTIERIVDESSDVSYAYFRKTGLERSDCISRDLEWLCDQGYDIPQPSKCGAIYAQYLLELSEKSPTSFLCHLYNIYFSHIAGGQVIVKQVTEKLLEGKDLAFYSWEGDAEELLREFREKLNALSEHWTRDERNRCLREARKAFRFLGQIVRLIIL